MELVGWLVGLVSWSEIRVSVYLSIPTNAQRVYIYINNISYIVSTPACFDIIFRGLTLLKGD
jgi:hypothetical protein